MPDPDQVEVQVVLPDGKQRRARRNETGELLLAPAYPPLDAAPTIAPVAVTGNPVADVTTLANKVNEMVARINLLTTAHK